MKVLLINPPFQRLKGIRTSYFPLGLGYLAAVLAQRQIDVKIYNAENPSNDECAGLKSTSFLMAMHNSYLEALKNENHLVWSEVTNVISEFQPDIVGMSVMTSKYSSALEITNICKKINHNIIIIWGGFHPSIRPDEVLSNYNVDFVVRGEGERTLTELVGSISECNKNYHEIDGLSFRKDGVIIHNKPRSLIQNLDEIPAPARNLSLKDKLYSPKDLNMLISSRGCPFRCTYCGASNIWGRMVRARSSGNVIKEMEDMIEQFGIREFYFVDDSFTVNRARVIELCEVIRRKGLDITWRCATRVDLIDTELIKEMKKAGCSGLHLGIETGSQRMLKCIKKGITLDQVKNAIQILRKNRMDWRAYFMVGFPQETIEDIKETMKFMKEIDPPAIDLSIFTPYPGTELFEDVMRLGFMPENPDWSQFDHQSPDNYFTKNIARNEFEEIVKQLSGEVDKLNNRFSALARRALGRSHYYWKHPVLFTKTVFEFLDKKL